MSTHRGFSLIEVLIAVTVLALGLLGLAAVFPVVVGQQRDASNASAGEAVVSSVRSYLSSHEVLNDPNRGWGAVNQSIGTTGRMWVPLTDAAPGAGLVTTWGSIAGADIVIPLSERFSPASSAVRSSGPRFVWDMAALAPDTTLGDDAGLVRAAVFVRPVDTNIRDRGNPGASAWNLLLSGNPPPRVPIAEDMGGVPTRNGDVGTSGAYAQLFSFGAEVYDYNAESVWSSGDRADAILITSVTDSIVGRSTREAESLLSRPGQRFVDRHGNVYRVTASKPIAGGVLIRIDPPVPSTVARSDNDETDISTDDINPFLASSVPPVSDPIVLEIRP